MSMVPGVMKLIFAVLYVSFNSGHSTVMFKMITVDGQKKRRVYTTVGQAVVRTASLLT